MTTQPTPQAGDETYAALLSAVAQLVEKSESVSRAGRNHALLATYWQVGRLVERALAESTDPGLIVRLSRDMNGRFESGFSVRNLHYMRKLHRAFARNELSGRLGWSHYRALVSLSRDEDREELHALALAEGLSVNQLLAQVRRREGLAGAKLNRVPGALRLYKVTTSSLATPRRGESVLDLGFEMRIAAATPGVVDPAPGTVLVATDTPRGPRYSVWGEGPRRYAYAGVVERVLDGDTLIAELDLGFGIGRRQRLRLKGLDTEALGTAEGERAYRFVRRRLRPGSRVVVETFTADPYGRYLGYVLYSPAADPTAESLIEAGRFLNQELLDAGLAVSLD